MNRKTIVRSGALLLILVVLVTGCGNSGKTPTATGPEPLPTSTTLEETSTKAPTQDDVLRITIDELLALVISQGTIVIVDTRSEVEYNMDHITGSVSAPLSAILDGEWEPPAYEQLIFYCAWPDENTSARAALELLEKGFTDIKALKGGYDAWKNAGYPMSSPPPVTTTPPPTTTTTPPPTTITTLSGIPPSGIGTASAEVAGNTGNHPILISGPLELTWDIIDSTIAIRGFPLIGVLTGTLKEDGTFSAVGFGDYIGYSVEVIFNGIITPEGISGMLIVGSDHSIPCCGWSIDYQIELSFT